MKELNLAGNRIGTKGVQVLTESLKVNTSLIILTGNQIGNKGVASLVEALKVNIRLRLIEIEQLFDEQVILNRRNRLESLQRKCARLIKIRELDCSPVPLFETGSLKGVKKQTDTLSRPIPVTSPRRRYLL